MKETDLFHSAIEHWWAVKNKAARKASKQGGARDQNLTGKNLDGFILTITKFLVDLGVDEKDIYVGGHLSKLAAILPSYFRPSKNWDIVVVSNSRFCSEKRMARPTLHAAIEFKGTLNNRHFGNPGRPEPVAKAGREEATARPGE